MKLAHLFELVNSGADVKWNNPDYTVKCVAGEYVVTSWRSSNTRAILKNGKLILNENDFFLQSGAAL